MTDEDGSAEDSDEEMSDVPMEVVKPVETIQLTKKVHTSPTVPITLTLHDAPAVASSATLRPVMSTTATGSMKRGRSTSNAASMGRDKFLVDPSLIQFPWGHPSVTELSISTSTPPTSNRPGFRRSRSSTLPRSKPTASTTLSPKALRAHLFPDSDTTTTGLKREEEDGTMSGMGLGRNHSSVMGDGDDRQDGGTGDAAPVSPDNNTSSDETASESEKTGGEKSRSDGKRRKGNDGTTVGVGGGGKGERGNWEVVDSVRLLDGIL